MDTTIATQHQKVSIHKDTPRGFEKALDLFQRAAQRVPAYKDFLNKQGVKPDSIHTPADFETIPPITKKDYLKQYPLRDLQWDGTFSDARIISMSSGSSGQPFFWFRGNKANEDSITLHEQIFNNNFHTLQKETLCVIAFAMGTWVAGTYTLNAVQELANRGHRVVCITPGINKGEIIHILKNAAPHFEQIILAGYPPFIKDVLDTAEYEGVDILSMRIHVLLAGENYSENWRSYVLDKINRPGDLYAITGIYGTADAGCLGFETPLSIFARINASQHAKLFSELFPDTSLMPTLVQYDPELRYFETENEHLLFTAENSIPLIRYKIMDLGRVITGDEMVNTLNKNGVPVPDHLQRFAENPFIALYTRQDVAATFYALNIYPENIKAGLEDKRLEKQITGKFILSTKYDEKQEQTLHLKVELRPDVRSSAKLKSSVRDSVVMALRAKNSEYNKLYETIGSKAVPYIHFAQYGSPEFTINVKHRWSQKNIDQKS